MITFLWILATFSAFFVKGLCGFANTLVFTTIMGFGADNLNISPVELILGYPANIIMAFNDRKSIKWSFCLPIIILLIIGSIPGMFILKTANPTPVKIACGAVVALAGLEMFLRDSKSSKMASSKLATLIVGIATGILCGLFGIGVILGAYLSRVADNMSEFKGNLSLIFAAENTTRIISYLILGIISFSAFKQALFLLPVMLIGLGAGIISAKFLNEKISRKLVTVMLMISGTSLILVNI